MKELLIKFLREEEGATAVEYGLMVSLIACAIIVAVQAVGTNLDAMFDAVAGKITTATPS
jgi:pilus assembly protein Flp/PilA